DRPGLSAATLHTMSLLDKSTATDFQNFVRVLHVLRAYPLGSATAATEPQHINWRLLIELGLVRESVITYRGHRFDGFELMGYRPGLMFVELALTVRGYEIAKVVFETADLSLHVDVQAEYLKRYISAELSSGQDAFLLVVPQGTDSSSIVIQIAA